MSESVQRQSELIAIRREELSQTLAALADKLDVKARGRRTVADLRDSAGRQLRPERLLVATMVVGAVTAAVCAVVAQRRPKPEQPPF